MPGGRDDEAKRTPPVMAETFIYELEGRIATPLEAGLVGVGIGFDQ